MKKLLLIIFLVSAFMFSCDLYPQDEYEQQYVIESYLVAGNQIPRIRVSVTAEADAFYDFKEQGILDANVVLNLMSSSDPDRVERTFFYTLFDPGIYIPQDAHNVQPNRTYQLSVSFPFTDDIITAVTTVPDTFRIAGGVQDTIKYRAEEQLLLTISRSGTPDRQNKYVFNSIAHIIRPDNLTPFYLELFQESDSPQEDLDLFANNNSGIINQGNFNPNPDGSFTIRYPWLGIAFYRENNLVVNSIDENLYDFVRSQEVQLGGTTLSPGEIQNVINNIEGGVGIFGSLAADTAFTFIDRGTF